MMKNNSTFILLFIVGYLTLCCAKALAQDSANTINKISISSPTAASLGKYGDIPISYNTGIPQIDIPLYTIKSKTLSMPLSLSYHASGLKVQESASWVGAGWSLNAGGAITRTVVGTPDDRGGSTNYFMDGYYSDSGFNAYLFVPGGNYGTAADGKTADDQHFVQGLKDGEPDMFSFNFAGVSGKFYFNDDRTPVFIPEQDLKLQTDFTLGTGFTGFVVTTPDGTKYCFGKSGNNGAVDPIEMTIPMTMEDGPAFQQKATASWFLNKVVSADNTDSILLSYASENYSYYTLSMFPVSYYKELATTPSAREGYNLVKNLVTGVRLSQINYLNGTATFSPSAAPRLDLLEGYPTVIGGSRPNNSSYSLETVQISNNAGFCKKFVWKYGYFHNDTNPLSGPVLGTTAYQDIHSDSYKLRLDTLQEISCDGSVQVPPYTFSYFAGTIPRTMSLAMDHWGYFNGATGNQGLIPSHWVKYQGILTQKLGANRDASFPNMLNGTLQKITYPTGGFTTFDFEANTSYVNYSTYTTTFRHSMGVGWGGWNGTLGDGHDNPLQDPVAFSANTYTLSVHNQDYSDYSVVPASQKTAYVRITNAAQVQVFSDVVTVNQTKNYTFQFPSGQYYIFIQKYNATGGNGANLTLNELLPTPVSGNTIIGGLRIKTIRTNDGATSKDIVTSYTYNVGNDSTGQSSGILYSKPDYVKLVKNRIYDELYGGGSYPNCNVLVAISNQGFPASIADQYYKSPASVRPMATVQGYHIGYNEVYVSQTGNGRSVYRYYGSKYWDSRISDVCNRIVDWDNTCDANISQTPAAPMDYEFSRGELKYEGHYNQAGQIVKDIWHYPSYQAATLLTPGHISTVANNVGLYTDYNLTSPRKLVDSTEETLYNPGTSTFITKTNVVYYASAYHRQPTQKVTYGSQGERLVSNYSYAFDLLPSTCTSISDGVTAYQNNVHNDTITYYSTLATCTPQTGISNCRYPTHVQFRENLSYHRITFMRQRMANFYNPVNAYKSAHDSAKNAALADYTPVLELQEQFINPILQTSTFRNGNLLKASYTAYAYSTNPSGKVYPSVTQTIDLVSPSATFLSAVVNASNTSITKDTRYLDFSTYKFDGGNLVEVTGRDGVSTSYIWGVNNTQPLVKAEGVSYATLKAANTAAGGNISTLRSQASLSGALLTTWTYVPMIGLSTETTPSLNKNTYEYDALFRLILVRDKNNNIIKQYDYKYQGLTQ